MLWVSQDEAVAIRTEICLWPWILNQKYLQWTLIIVRRRILVMTSQPVFPMLFQWKLSTLHLYQAGIRLILCTKTVLAQQKGRLSLQTSEMVGRHRKKLIMALTARWDESKSQKSHLLCCIHVTVMYQLQLKMIQKMEVRNMNIIVHKYVWTSGIVYSKICRSVVYHRNSMLA